MRDFHGLKVWEKAHCLALSAYRVTARYPAAEQYGLTSQIRRAAASIPANIAEGCGRDGAVELARFCQIALGSASELEYHFILSHDLGYLPMEEYQSLEGQVIEVKQMLHAFISRLR